MYNMHVETQLLNGQRVELQHNTCRSFATVSLSCYIHFWLSGEIQIYSLQRYVSTFSTKKCTSSLCRGTGEVQKKYDYKCIVRNSLRGNAKYKYFDVRLWFVSNCFTQICRNKALIFWGKHSSFICPFHKTLRTLLQIMKNVFGCYKNS